MELKLCVTISRGKLLFRTLLAAAAIVIAAKVAECQGAMVRLPAQAASAENGEQPRYRLVHDWELEKIPPGYRVVAGGYYYFILEKLPAGAPEVKYKCVGQDGAPTAQFLGQLNLEGAVGYRYVAWRTIGVPDILERQADSPGYEYRVVTAKAEKMNEAAKDGFRFVGLRFFHKGELNWQKDAIMERPLKGQQTGGTPIAEVSTGYEVSRTFNKSDRRKNIEKFTAAGYCAVHVYQSPRDIVFEKKKEGSAPCEYESLEWKEQIPKRKCPWYLSCSPLIAEAESYGRYMEEGLNRLGARGFHLFGLSVDLGLKPLMERDETTPRHYEYRMVQMGDYDGVSRMILINARASEEVNQAAQEGFSVVNMASNRWGKYYVVMERSDEP
jgi:hypothetical protein